MKIFSTIKDFMKGMKNAELPMECKDKYIITSEDKLQYHLMINYVLDNNDINYSFDDKLEAAYRAIKSRTDQWEMSLALLDRMIALKKAGVTWNVLFDLKYEQIASKYFSIHKATFDEYASFFQYSNDNSELDFPMEIELADQLLKIVQKEDLPKKLKEEIRKRYQKDRDSQNEISSTAVRLGKLIGEYDPVQLMRENYDSTFAEGETLEFLSDNYPITSEGKYNEEQKVIDDYLQEDKVAYGALNSKNGPEQFQMVLSESKEVQKNYVMALIYRIIWQDYNSDHNYPLYQFVNGLVRKKLPYTEKEMIITLKSLNKWVVSPNLFSSPSFFKNIEAHVKSNGLNETLENGLKEFLTNERPNYVDKNSDKIRLKIKELFAQQGTSSEDDIQVFFMEEGDPFGKEMNQYLRDSKSEFQKKWYDLFRVANGASAGKPTKTFIKKATAILDKVGKKSYKTHIQGWIQYLIKMELTEENQWHKYLISPNNVSTIKGLIWIFSLLNTDELDSEIEKLIVRCFKKIPGIGPTSAAVGNACIYAVAERKSLSGVALLNRVRSKISQRNTKALIGKYINNIATELNIAVADLEDFSIPDFGLTDGEKTIPFNDYAARISIPKMGKVLTEWIKPDGTQQKSIPSFVKKDFAKELKAMRAEIKLMPKSLSIQRDRLDRAYISKRKLNYEHFEKYYLNHGLMAYLCKKLIWVFEKKAKKAHAILQQGKWLDVKGKEVKWVAEAEVRLWHPLDSETAEVLAWREYMQKHEIKQPLKQAYREIYILTDAEINTRTYSNRMAGHILKQHQFNALAGLRGWKYQLLGAYDDGRENEICELKIPDYELSAEYWINELYAEEAWNDAGIYLYVTTDQVRFTKGEEILPLVDIPKIVFSEAMRDVDLFVGVGSVGNDPEWRDNGGLPNHREYWQSYSFGDLTEVAKTRKSVLEKLLPRLKIAKVSEIDGKFLKVKGSKHTYKIHIGSTNILMEPNDQYLCIVPDRNPKGADNLFIPFEGDRGLSIVLSKAFMLAEDEKITDSTILSQIG